MSCMYGGTVYKNIAYGSTLVGTGTHEPSHRAIEMGKDQSDLLGEHGASLVPMKLLTKHYPAADHCNVEGVFSSLMSYVPA